MSRRLTLADEALLPWQVPDLDGAARSLETGVRPPPPKPRPIIAREAERPAPRPDTQIETQRSKGYEEGSARGHAEGREKGYAAGLEEGRAAVAEALAAQGRRLEAAIGKLAEPIRALERPVEEAVVALGLEVARRVIGSEVSRSRDYLLRLVREAVAKVPIEMGAPTILLNPADVALVRAVAPDIESGDISLVADDSVDAGGCLVVANASGAPIKDKRWYPRSGEGASQVDLTLASRWRSVMLALFDNEGE